MARCRTMILGALMAAGACLAMPAPAQAGNGVVQVQYYAPERPNYAPRPYYNQGPRRRQVCWTEQRRVHVGYDNWGRALYRRVPQRVCRWQYY